MNNINNIYNNMSIIYKPPRISVNQFGNIISSSKTPDDFKYLLGISINAVISFDNGTDELLEQGAIILPRYYHVFVGTKDGELQYKPYEYDKYRIVVSTYKDVIILIESLG